MRRGQPFRLGPLAGRVQEVERDGADVTAHLDTRHGPVRVLARAAWRGLVLIIPAKEGT